MQIHQSEKSNWCEECGKSFSSAGYLKKHILLHNQENTKKIPCLLCSKTFLPRSIERKRHMLLHTEGKPFDCDICGQSIKHAKNLQKHLLSHGKEPIKCTYCELTFTQPCHLKQHVLKHTGEKQYKCSYCVYESASKYYLQKHEMSHTGTKPHKCPSCSYAFVHPVELRNHLMTHTGEKPHKCDQCDYAAILAASLRKHMEIHFQEEGEITETENATEDGETTEVGEII